MEINLGLDRAAKPDELLAHLRSIDPTCQVAGAKARETIFSSSREIYPWQAEALYVLANRYNYKGASFLEIGTAYGYSAAIMALAAPLAKIVTLNPSAHEAQSARDHLAGFPQIAVLEEKSWDYFDQLVYHLHGEYDLIFVDGDHKRVAHDFPYWNALKFGGLMLFHDYSPEWSGRPCPVVYDALNDFGDWLGRTMDVLIVDDKDTGMGGWFRQPDDLRFYDTPPR